MRELDVKVWYSSLNLEIKFVLCLFQLHCFTLLRLLCSFCVHLQTHILTHSMITSQLSLPMIHVKHLCPIWMDPEIVIWSEVSQIEKEKYCMTSLVCGIWTEMLQMNFKIEQIHRFKEIEFMVARGKDGDGLIKGFKHTAVFKTDNQQGPHV